MTPNILFYYASNYTFVTGKNCASPAAWMTQVAVR